MLAFFSLSHSAATNLHVPRFFPASYSRNSAPIFLVRLMTRSSTFAVFPSSLGAHPKSVTSARPLSPSPGAGSGGDSDSDSDSYESTAPRSIRIARVTSPIDSRYAASTGASHRTTPKPSRVSVTRTVPLASSPFFFFTYPEKLSSNAGTTVTAYPSALARADTNGSSRDDGGPEPSGSGSASPESSTGRTRSRSLGIVGGTRSVSASVSGSVSASSSAADERRREEDKRTTATASSSLRTIKRRGSLRGFSVHVSRATNGAPRGLSAKSGARERGNRRGRGAA